MDANSSWWVSELMAAECRKSVAPSRMEAHNAVMVQEGA